MLDLKKVRPEIHFFVWLFGSVGISLFVDVINEEAVLFYLSLWTILMLAVYLICLVYRQREFYQQQHRIIQALKALDDQSVYRALYMRAVAAKKLFQQERKLLQPKETEMEVEDPERITSLRTIQGLAVQRRSDFWALHDTVVVTHTIPDWDTLPQYAEVNPDDNPGYWENAVFGRSNPKNAEDSTPPTGDVTEV